MKKIAILGCGNGGMALAAYYAYLDHQINLWSDPAHTTKLNGLKNGTGITANGYINKTVHVKKATVNLQEAVEGTEIVVICLPRQAHLEVFKKLLPYLDSKQIIIVLPGNFSIMELNQYMLENNIIKKLNIIEANTFPFACRSDLPGQVDINAAKTNIGLAGNTPSESRKIASKIKALIPAKINIYPDIILLGLENSAGITHPLNMLFSAARIDNGDNVFYFYRDGISKKTALVHEKLDEERMIICNLWGYKARKCVEIDNDLYSNHFESMYQSIIESKTWNKTKKAPPGLEHRYVTEDVPHLLVTWYLLGLKKGYIAKTMEDVIHLFSIMNETNYFDTIKYV